MKLTIFGWGTIMFALGIVSLFWMFEYLTNYDMGDYTALIVSITLFLISFAVFTWSTKESEEK